MAYEPHKQPRPQPMQPMPAAPNNAQATTTSVDAYTAAASMSADAVLATPVRAVLAHMNTPAAVHEQKIMSLGADTILDMLSAGMLVEEIAVGYGLPIRQLHAWVSANIPLTDLSEARTRAAALFRARAVRVAERIPAKGLIPADVSRAKLQVDAYRDMAEALDPDWKPRPDNGSGAAPLSVVFNMMHADGGVSTATAAPTALHDNRIRPDIVDVDQVTMTLPTGDTPDADTSDETADTSDETADTVDETVDTSEVDTD